LLLQASNRPVFLDFVAILAYSASKHLQDGDIRIWNYPMKIERKIADSPRTRAIAARVSGLSGPCVGCRECRGLCEALLDALILPEIVLRSPEN
jgi:hypothetical protein